MRLKVKFLIFFVGLILCGISLCSGKVFDRCELAQELKYRQNIPYEQVSVWVCIAQFQSGFNTSAVGYQGDGSGYHGLYQISDVYWCSPPNVGWVCSTTCSHFEDDDITDDILCMKKIYDEHQRISGDGFNAWSVYQPHCRGQSEQYIQGCFDNYISNQPNYYDAKSIVSYITPLPVIQTGKIYDRCELARELKYKHNLPFEQISTWVCIAQHESNFNTSAIGRLNADGSGDHGIFQISDIYWCSPPGKGWVCGLTCSQLEDNDITDDVNCMKKIFEEHQRLSGDGFNAWTVYRLYCQGRSESYITGCFDTIDDNSINNFVSQPTVLSSVNTYNRKTEYSSVPKIYDRCELANELKNVHNIPIEQIATWVCIAQHESSFNTSAIGRLNADGSGDHGLFQISDIYWCSPPGNGWACGLTCSQLEDNDITDDVTCMKKIYAEHQRISGDGFNAWTVYNRNCKGRADQYIQGCFNDLDNSIYRYNPAVTQPPTSIYKQPTGPAKIYDRCELANELRNVHNIPIEQIATWVCIAQHESSFNTSAIGRLNADGSGDHGLFQISDIYWCSPPGNGWACGLTCSQLEDNDITDDVTCIKKIYEEHQRISGDGFNAWTVYNRNCKGRSEQYIQGCFADTTSNLIDVPKTTKKPFPSTKYNYNSYFSSTSKSSSYQAQTTTTLSSLQYNYNQYYSTTPKPNTPGTSSPYNYFGTSTKSSVNQLSSTKNSTSFAYNTSSSSFFYNPTTKVTYFPQITLTVPTQKPYSSTYTQANPVQASKINSFQIFTQTNKPTTKNYFQQPNYTNQKSSQYASTTTSPTTKSHTNFNNYYQTQTTQKPYYENTFVTASTNTPTYYTKQVYSSPFSTQFNSQTQKSVTTPSTPLYNYQNKTSSSYSSSTQHNTQKPRSTSIVQQPQFTNSNYQTQYNTQTQRPSYTQSQQPLVTNIKLQSHYTFPSTTSLFANHQSKPISSFSFSSLPKAETQIPGITTGHQPQTYTNYKSQYPTVSSATPNYKTQSYSFPNLYTTKAYSTNNNNYNSNQQYTSSYKPFINSNASPATQFHYNGQSYPTVKPFSLEYIKQITTPKTTYPVYLQSPSTSVEVTLKPTTLSKELQSKIKTTLYHSASTTSIKKVAPVSTTFDNSKQTTKQYFNQIKTTLKPKITSTIKTTTFVTTIKPFTNSKLLTSTTTTTKPSTTAKPSTTKPVTTKKSLITKTTAKFPTTKSFLTTKQLTTTYKPFTTTKFSTTTKPPTTKWATAYTFSTTTKTPTTKVLTTTKPPTTKWSTPSLFTTTKPTTKWSTPSSFSSTKQLTTKWSTPSTFSTIKPPTTKFSTPSTFTTTKPPTTKWSTAYTFSTTTKTPSTKVTTTTKPPTTKLSKFTSKPPSTKHPSTKWSSAFSFTTPKPATSKWPTISSFTTTAKPTTKWAITSLPSKSPIDKQLIGTKTTIKPTTTKWLTTKSSTKFPITSNTTIKPSTTKWTTIKSLINSKPTTTTKLFTKLSTQKSKLQSASLKQSSTINLFSTTQKTTAKRSSFLTTTRPTTHKSHTLSLTYFSPVSTTQKPPTKTITSTLKPTTKTKLITLSSKTLSTTEKPSHFDLWFNQFKHEE